MAVFYFVGPRTALVMENSWSYFPAKFVTLRKLANEISHANILTDIVLIVTPKPNIRLRVHDKQRFNITVVVNEGT